MKKNVLIIGAGGVAHVAAHKCAMHNDVLGDICIASRTQSKCDAIIESVLFGISLGFFFNCHNLLFLAYNIHILVINWEIRSQ